MAVDANAYQAADVIQKLEDVRDVVYRVSPEETPLILNAPVANAKAVKHEWHVDRLDAPDTANAHLDGDEFDGEAVTPTERLTNELQIFRKDFIISRRARIIAKAGERDEVARIAVKKGFEMRRDMEAIFLNNQAFVADTDGATIPLAASIQCYITNSARAGDGADPVGADGSAQATDGTPRALSESDVLDVIRQIYDDSQDPPNTIMMETQVKQQFSKYMFSSSARVATQYQDQGKNPRGGVQVIGAVGVYVSDYCVLDCVPNRFQRARDVIIYNTNQVDVAYLDSMKTDVMAKTADTFDRMVIADATLVVRNPDCIGVVADIDPASPMVA